MPPTDDKRTLVATRLGEIRPTGLGGLDLTYQSRQIGDARKDLPNVWGDVNTFQGVRFTPKKLIAGEDGVSYDLGPLDYEISIDASDSNFTFNLPFALGNGQEFRVKRLDDSSNVVSVVAKPGELIDGDDTVFLSAQYDFMPLSDAADGTWNKQGSIGSIIPSDIARLSQHNQFTNVNTFTGIQVGTKTIKSSLVSAYEITEFDYEILAVCDAGPLIFYLPFATGNGQVIRIKKKDDTADIATVILVASIADLTPNNSHLPGMLILKAKAFAAEKGISGYKLTFHVGKEGGQEVPYLHLHFLSEQGLS